MLKALGRIKKKMRFKFVFEPVHMIGSTDTARQPIPKMRPSHRKGTIARLFLILQSQCIKTYTQHILQKGHRSQRAPSKGGAVT